MKLHEDPEVFAELIAATATHIGLPQVYVEKDYWVTNALRNLSQSDCKDEAVFKGGTSLSKAYRIIDRFSEDIDLVVFADGKSANAVKRLLKKVEQAAAQGLIEIEDDERTSKHSSFRKTVHTYPRHTKEEDFGQASPELLIEVNSFTNPEPYQERELQSLIAEMLCDTDKDDLIRVHDLQSFSIQVLSVERTLVEKILGVIKDSYDVDPTAKLSARIRHIYDVALIVQNEEYRKFLSSDEFKELCKKCIEDEKVQFERTAYIFDTPLSEAPIFEKFPEWRPSLEATYNGVFKGLVYRDLPSMDVLEETLSFIRDHLR